MGIGKEKKGAFVGLDPGGTYDNLVYLSLHLWETLIKEETDSGTLNTQPKLTPLIKPAVEMYT